MDHPQVCTISPGYHCYAVAWSPFLRDSLAVVSGTHYGLKGSGRAEVVHVGSGSTQCHLLVDWCDVITDITWSESSPTILLVGTGDRAVLILDTLNRGSVVSKRVEHKAEVSCVTWSQVRGHQAALSTSWDGTAKQWDPERLASTQTYPVSTGRVYDAAWSPTEAGRFATAAGDGLLGVWSAAAGRRPVVTVRCSGAELLSCDWSRYCQHQVCAAGVDGCLWLWDLRRPTLPLLRLAGHTKCVKKVRYSAFNADMLATVSYDRTCRLWSVADGRCVGLLGNHTEFVYGLDWSVLERDVLATCGWDSSVQVHRVPTVSPLPTGQPPVT